MRPSFYIATALAAILLTGCQDNSAAPSAPPSETPKVAPKAFVGPALWVVKDADTTIYLFGTFHMLKADSNWFKGPVRAAFDASDTLVTEIIQPDNPMALGPATIALATDPAGRSLEQKLPPQAREPYRAFVVAQGLTPKTLDKYEAWYVSSALATARFKKLGLDPKSGAERVLVTALPPAKKHEALETPQAQLAMLDSVPEAEQLDALAQLVTSKGDPVASTDAMLKRWETGDAEGLASVKNASLYKLEGMSRIMLFDRNRRWAGWIKQRMATPGTVFMAVGSGHLAGQNSVQHYLLVDQNLKAERIIN